MGSELGKTLGLKLSAASDGLAVGVGYLLGIWEPLLHPPPQLHSALDTLIVTVVALLVMVSTLSLVLFDSKIHDAPRTVTVVSV